jgi:hypothetical protein
MEHRPALAGSWVCYLWWGIDPLGSFVPRFVLKPSGLLLIEGSS